MRTDRTLVTAPFSPSNSRLRRPAPPPLPAPGRSSLAIKLVGLAAICVASLLIGAFVLPAASAPAPTNNDDQLASAPAEPASKPEVKPAGPVPPPAPAVK